MNRYLLLLLPALSACGSLPEVNVEALLNPWRIDVRQGNYVSQEMVAQLKPGQTRDQVRFILGSPLVADVFHADRWDYIYRFAAGNGDVQQRRLAVFFQNDKLLRVGGDVLASSGTAAVAEPAPTTRVINIPDPAAASDGKK